MHARPTSKIHLLYRLHMLHDMASYSYDASRKGMRIGKFIFHVHGRASLRVRIHYRIEERCMVPVHSYVYRWHRYSPRIERADGVIARRREYTRQTACDSTLAVTTRQASLEVAMSRLEILSWVLYILKDARRKELVISLYMPTDMRQLKWPLWIVLL